MHPRIPLLSDRRFFLALGIAAAGVALAGFGPTYYFRFLGSALPLSLIVHVHAALFTAWLALLLTQVSLVRAGNFAWHRRLGLAAVALVVLMVTTGFVAVLGKPRLTIDSRAFIFTPLLTLVIFPALVAAAIYFRRDPAAHKRLMFLATIAISTAAVARLMTMAGLTPSRYWAYAATYAVLLLPLVIYDLRKFGRPHSATIWGSAALLIRHPLHAGIAYTEEWQAIADWLTPG